MLKKLSKLIVFTLIIFSLWKFFLPTQKRELLFQNQPKSIILCDNGLEFELKTKAQTVDNLLAEQKIALSQYDEIIPDKNSLLWPGAYVQINRAVKITIFADGKTIENYTLSRSLPLALKENGITLGRLDKTTPGVFGLLENNLKITVTRINVEKKVIPQDIPYKTITKLDAHLGWREKKIEVAGEKGILEVEYKITYKNGQEISRVALEKKIVKEPIAQIETQGTYVETGPAKKGQGTWYAYQGGLFAASITIPRGHYARVTNTANGKSVIVQINDYGPQGKGRIIDLDKVAFQKIAPLGAGVIGVKVEEVLN